MENKRNKKVNMEDKNFMNEFAEENGVTAAEVERNTSQPTYAEEVGQEISPTMPKAKHGEEPTASQEEHFAGGMTVDPDVLKDSVAVPPGTRHKQLEELAQQYKGSEFDQTGKNVPKYSE